MLPEAPDKENDSADSSPLSSPPPSDEDPETPTTLPSTPSPSKKRKLVVLKGEFSSDSEDDIPLSQMRLNSSSASKIHSHNIPHSERNPSSPTESSKKNMLTTSLKKENKTRRLLLTKLRLSAKNSKSAMNWCFTTLRQRITWCKTMQSPLHDEDLRPMVGPLVES